MRLLYKSIYIISIYEYYVMLLYTLNLEMIEHVYKYFEDFCNFISLVIRDESQKYQTFEGFFEALYLSFILAELISSEI